MTKTRGRRWSSMFDNFRDDCAAASLEFIGTTFFLFLGLGAIQAATTESGKPTTTSDILYISTAFGLSLLVSAWLFFRATGGLFNPNVTLALFLVGGIGLVRFVLYCLAQLVGAIAGAAIVRSLTSAPLAGNTSLHQGTNRAQGVFIEMFITSALVLSVLMLAAEKHQVTPFAPVGIGLTLFVCHLFAVLYTGAGMNTARSFGPAVVTGFSTPNHWVYWLGPFLGSLLGVALYTALKHLEYWKLSPHQATSDFTKSPADPLLLVKKATGERSRTDEQSNGTPRREANEAQVSPDVV